MDNLAFAGMALSDILADRTAPTGGILQHPHSTGPLVIDCYLTSTYPWIFVNYSLPLRATSETMWERTDGDVRHRHPRRHTLRGR